MWTSLRIQQHAKMAKQFVLYVLFQVWCFFWFCICLVLWHGKDLGSCLHIFLSISLSFFSFSCDAEAVSGGHVNNVTTSCSMDQSIDRSLVIHNERVFFHFSSLLFNLLSFLFLLLFVLEHFLRFHKTHFCCNSRQLFG